MDRITDVQTRIAAMRTAGAGDAEISSALLDETARLQALAADLARDTAAKALDTESQVAARLVELAWLLLDLQRAAQPEEVQQHLEAALRPAVEVQVSVRLHRALSQGGSASVSVVAVDAQGEECALRLLELAAPRAS